MDYIFGTVAQLAKYMLLGVSEFKNAARDFSINVLKLAGPVIFINKNTSGAFVIILNK